MGLFENLRNTVSGVRQMMRDVDAANRATLANAPLDILNPSPQHEVDRLLAAGGVVRGVVASATHAPLSPGERVSKLRVTIRARSRLGGGQLGPEAEVKIWTSWQVTALLDRGLEIPVIVDRATGQVVDIPADLLSRELEPWFGESARRWPGWGSDYF